MRRRVIALVVLATAQPVLAQVDYLFPVLTKTEATGSTGTLRSFGYDPVTDTAYTISGSGGGMRKITGVFTGTKVSTQEVDANQWLNFMKSTESTDYSVGNPAPFGGFLNKRPINTPVVTPAYSRLYTVELGNNVVTQVGPIRHNELTKRIYNWNLQNAGTLPSGGFNVLGSNVTLDQLFQSAGYAADANSNVQTIRRVVEGFDNRSGYFNYNANTVTASVPFPIGGIWRVDLASGGVQRLVNGVGNSLVQSGGELGVGKLNATTDRIYFDAYDSTANSFGVGYVDYDHQAGAVVGSPTVLISGAQLRQFIRGDAATSYGVNAITATETGELYIDLGGGSSSSGATSRRHVLLRADQLDAATPRLVKVTTYAERRAAFAATSVSVSGIDVRDVTVGGVPVQQLTWIDTSSVNAHVGGANVYRVGDFNRDGAVTLADVNLFGAALAPVGTLTTDAAKYKFDLDGAVLHNNSSGTPNNGSVDHYDVRVLQSFLGFLDGDADFNGVVNFDDLLKLAANYNVTGGRVWTQGDFNGDNAVNFDDLLKLAANYNQSGSTPLSGGAFALAQSIVPEPSAILAIALAAPALSRGTRFRRRTRGE